jgi:hypothetical protein
MASLREAARNVSGSDIAGEPGTGFEERGDLGPFECGNCKSFDQDNGCHNKNMMAKSKRPRKPDGRIQVTAPDCCEYIHRMGRQSYGG